jgi:GNAT superfamily N-acetyltransferase
LRPGYSISVENGAATYPIIEPLYRRHYAEMQSRLASDGIEIGPYAPRLDEYFAAWNGGWLVNYVVWFDGAVVGYSNIYLTNDMHNGEFIAQEDTIFVDKPHRNGVGRDLAKFILEDLRARGVKRASITPVTDLRVGKIWERMGFKPTAQLMTFVF